MAKQRMFQNYNKSKEKQALVDEVVNEVMKRLTVEIQNKIPNIKEIIEKGLKF